MQSLVSYALSDEFPASATLDHSPVLGRIVKTHHTGPFPYRYSLTGLGLVLTSVQETIRAALLKS